MFADGLLAVRTYPTSYAIQGTLVGLNPIDNTSAWVYTGVNCDDVKSPYYTSTMPTSKPEAGGVISSLNIESPKGTLNAAAGRTSDSLTGRVVLVRDDTLKTHIACGVIRSMVPGMYISCMDGV